MEEFRPIDGLKGYEVSNRGNIRCWRGMGRQTLATQPRNVSLCHTSTSPYWYFKYAGGQMSVHRAVAKTFLPNPEGFTCVNHIDEDKLNNDVSNLEWCSSEYNNQYSLGHQFSLISPDGYVIDFASVGEAARLVGTNNGNMSRLVNRKKYKQIKGWRLYDE